MTGTVTNAAAQVITDLKSDSLQLGFTNDSGAALTEGQEVILKTTGLVDKRSSGTTKPLGIVIKGGANGERVTVRVFCTAVVNAIATGSTLNAGVYVKPNGTKNSDNYPQYVAVASGDYAVGYVIKGGTATSVIKVGIMDSPVLIP